MGLLDRVISAATSLLRPPARTGARTGRQDRQVAPRPGGAHVVATTTIEYTGELPPLEYRPQRDDLADPGEVVWAWVPYDENDGRGKDRPVLVIARHDDGYLGLQATSKDHDRDRADEARWGRFWFDIGTGAWDSRGRESEVRLDRVLWLPESAIRREGAGLDKPRFDAVAHALLTLRAEPPR